MFFLLLFFCSPWSLWQFKNDFICSRYALFIWFWAGSTESVELNFRVGFFLCWLTFYWIDMLNITYYTIRNFCFIEQYFECGFLEDYSARGSASKYYFAKNMTYHGVFFQPGSLSAEKQKRNPFDFPFIFIDKYLYFWCRKLNFSRFFFCLVFFFKILLKTFLSIERNSMIFSLV